MQWLISAFLAGWLIVHTAYAGPVEFGWDELQKAIEARNLSGKLVRVTAEVSMTDRPETFEIVPNRISGGDLRGLMYGLLEAAEQVRSKGKLTAARGEPGVRTRGIRVIVKSGDVRQPQAFWTTYFQMLARARFNRFHLLLEEDVPVETIRMISEAANSYAVDFTLGLTSQQPLASVLTECPGIRALYLHWPHAVDIAIPIVREAGRLVNLELPANAATMASGVPVRLVQDLAVGEAHPPLETLTAGTAPMLRYVPAPAQVDTGFVRRVVAAAGVGYSQGLEVLAPPLVTDAEAFYMIWGRLVYQPSLPDSALPASPRAAVARAVLESAKAERAAPSLDVVQRLHGAALALEQDGAKDPEVLKLAQKIRYRARLLWGRWMSGYFEKTQHDSARLSARNELRGALRLAQTLGLPVEELQQEVKRLEDAKPREELTALPWPKETAKPALRHQAPSFAHVGKPLPLVVTVWPITGVQAIRLHYRRLPGMHSPGSEGFTTIENPAKLQRFTIPARALDDVGQLIYYFEVVHEGGSWRLPGAHSPLEVYVTEVRTAPLIKALEERKAE